CCSGDDPTWMRLSIGSPGTRWMIMKITTETASVTGTSNSNRLRTKLSIPVFSSRLIRGAGRSVVHAHVQDGLAREARAADLLGEGQLLAVVGKDLGRLVDRREGELGQDVLVVFLEVRDTLVPGLRLVHRLVVQLFRLGIVEHRDV